MVDGDPGHQSVHATQPQANNYGQDLAIIQRQKMEVHPAQGHLQIPLIVSPKRYKTYDILKETSSITCNNAL